MENQKGVTGMTAIIITAIICLTLAYIATLGNKTDNKKDKEKQE